MKIKLLYFSVLLLASFHLQAQEDEDDYRVPDIEQDNVRATGNNELSLNAFNLIVFAALDASYERILNENTSVELGVFTRFKDVNDDIETDEIFAKEFSVTGSYNWFFSETKRARGFYMKGFMMYSSGEYDEYIHYYYDENGNYQEEYEGIEYSDLAIGIGVGGKFMHKKGFFTDLHFGIGRNLFNDDSPEIIALFDVNLGFRF
ncbi:hypothetical protein [Mesonia sp. K7]|uniref:hypothetical protein n=1 Tax=Mesonia sp. K7 TaxID=2218606 RepID=UPI000DA991D1|nr:hypothetical protein [Mesonia sp. K7]PZD79192.1 hypothetical protein DNG35_01505 [Mesonia sp. K7]